MVNIKGNLIQSTLLITFCSLIGIAISFIAQLIIAYYFGAKFERDAYFVASTVPVYLSAIYIGSIGIVFLPKVIDVINVNPIKLTSFLSTAFWGLTIISVLLGAVCILFSSKIIDIVATGFDEQQNVFTARILIITIPTFIFTVLSNLLSSLYQIQHKFLRPALAPIITSVVSLVFVIVLSKKIGIFGLAYGFLAGSILSFVFLLPILKIFKIKFLMDLKSVEFISFIKTTIPLFLSGLLFRSTNIFERTFASNLQEGSISFLGYSSQILAIIATLTSNGIGVSVYPTLSKLWSEKRMTDLSNFFTKAVRIILLISLPIALAIIFFGDVFVKILFERGAFNHNVTIAVSLALTWSMGAFIFQGLGNVVTKMFYISGKTTLISIIASAEIIIYISLGYFLSKYFSYIGLSIALSISTMVNIILSYVFINKKIISLKISTTFIDILKITLISFISLILVYILYHFVFFKNTTYLFICIVPWMVLFYFLGLLFRIEEFMYIRHFIKNFNFKNYGTRN